MYAHDKIQSITVILLNSNLLTWLYAGDDTSTIQIRSRQLRYGKRTVCQV